MRQGISRIEHAQDVARNTGHERSHIGRSNEALWATMMAAPSTKAATASASMVCPATIVSLIPVSRVTSGGIGALGRLQLIEHVDDAENVALRRIREFDHAELDDLGVLDVERVRLGIEHDADMSLRAGAVGKSLLRFQPPQDAIVLRLFQLSGHGFEIERHRWGSCAVSAGKVGSSSAACGRLCAAALMPAPDAVGLRASADLASADIC